MKLVLVSVVPAVHGLIVMRIPMLDVIRVEKPRVTVTPTVNGQELSARTVMKDLLMLVLWVLHLVDAVINAGILRSVSTRGNIVNLPVAVVVPVTNECR